MYLMIYITIMKVFKIWILLNLINFWFLYFKILFTNNNITSIDNSSSYILSKQQIYLNHLFSEITNVMKTNYFSISIFSISIDKIWEKVGSNTLSSDHNWTDYMMPFFIIKFHYSLNKQHTNQANLFKPTFSRNHQCHENKLFFHLDIFYLDR